MKKLLDIILLTVLVVFSSCNSNTDAFLTGTSPQLFGICQVNTGSVVQDKDSIAFTDLDITWFNPKQEKSNLRNMIK